jgi:Peptidase family M28
VMICAVELEGSSAFVSDRFAMPGTSRIGPLPPLTDEELGLVVRLEAHVRRLAGDIGERHVWRPEALGGSGTVHRDDARCGGAARCVAGVCRRRCAGAQHRGRDPWRPSANEIIIVGAHYDSVFGCPGANDNATGTAAALEIARSLAGHRPLARTVRIVAFINEEPPFFQTPKMGSLVYARRARERGERILAMLSLETIGWYSDAPGSQQYPLSLPLGFIYPTTANFIAFVGNVRSRDLTRRALGSFRRHTAFRVVEQRAVA